MIESRDCIDVLMHKSLKRVERPVAMVTLDFQQGRDRRQFERCLAAKAISNSAV